MKTPAPHLAFSDTTLAGEGEKCTSWLPDWGTYLGSHLSFPDRSEGASLFCGIWLECLLSKSVCLVRLPLLAREQASQGVFSWSEPMASPAPSPGQMRQKENPGHSPPCCSSGSKVPSQSVFSLPLTFSLFYTNVQLFWLYVIGGIGKSTSSSPLVFNCLDIPQFVHLLTKWRSTFRQLVIFGNYE